jgi:hypothetical protein
MHQKLVKDNKESTGTADKATNQRFADTPQMIEWRQKAKKAIKGWQQHHCAACMDDRIDAGSMAVSS